MDLIQGYRSDPAQVKAAISRVDGSGFTSLYEAVSLAAVIPGALDEPCSYVLLFTDGIDTSSSFSLQSTLDQVRAAGVPIISIAMGAAPDTSVLDSFSLASGGITVSGSNQDAALRAVASFRDK
jgi:hypothetical protein